MFVIIVIFLSSLSFSLPPYVKGNVYKKAINEKYDFWSMLNVHDGAEFKNKRICPMDAWFIFNLQIKNKELATSIHTQLS